MRFRISVSNPNVLVVFLEIELIFCYREKRKTFRDHKLLKLIQLYSSNYLNRFNNMMYDMFIKLNFIKQ